MSSSIKIAKIPEIEYTLISNDFIDYYMPQAAGSYVKVYLSMLRWLTANHSECTISDIADRLDETEKDILRALKYWEKQELLQLTRDDEGNLTKISFLTPKVPEKASTPVSESSAALCPATQAADTVDSTAPTVRFEIPDYSDSQIASLTSIDEVQWIMQTLPQLLERLLKPADVQFVLYLYESVGFPADLIIYLYEYCASKNKKTHSYIESVALAWAKKGINTLEKAEAETSRYSKDCTTVLRAFGLNRSLAKVENEYIQRWFREYRFSAEIVEEACNRTILAVSKPDFKYADSILTKWHKAEVKTKNDILALDSRFAKQNTLSERKPSDTSSPAPAGNRFNAFPQRKYSAADYSLLEERLLKK